MGEIVWQKYLGGTGYNTAYSIQQTGDGGYIFAGFTRSNDGDVSGNYGDALIVKLESENKRSGGCNAGIGYTCVVTLLFGAAVLHYKIRK
jgi:hypothetical protein